MMPMSPPLLLPLNGKVSVTVSRAAGGAYVKGVWVASTRSSLTIVANIQPVLKSTEVMMLPEGERSKETIKLYTTTTLYQRVEGDNSIEGDLIEWDGKTWEVCKVIEYKMGILDHVKAIAVRKELT